MLRAKDQMAAEIEAPTLTHIRTAGNRLRELDRFLSILIDEAALFLGGPDHDGPSFARLRNTPNKLRLLEAMMGLASEEHGRLRAIGRIGACLHHCSGRIHRRSLHQDILLAQGETDISFLPTGRDEALRLAPQTLISICAFYGMIGDRLSAEVLRRTSDLDFRELRVHLARANVACDGT